MKSAILALVALLAAIVLSAGCAQSEDQGRPTSPAPPAAYVNISPGELNDRLKKKDFVLIDVHVPEQKHIAGTDLVIPFDQIDRNLGKLPADKSQKIVVYCRSGSMSMEASQKLVQLGYKDVANLDGGTMAWQASGYTVP